MTNREVIAMASAVMAFFVIAILAVVLNSILLTCVIVAVIAAVTAYFVTPQKKIYYITVNGKYPKAVEVKEIHRR